MTVQKTRIEVNAACGDCQGSGVVKETEVDGDRDQWVPCGNGCPSVSEADKEGN